MSSQDLQILKRTNTELKRAIRYFLEAAPNSGPLGVQVNNIKDAIKSNETMFTFASLVEQYAKMKKNFDNVGYQNQKADLAKFKAIVKKSGSRNLSSNQLEKVESLLAELDTTQPVHKILMSAGQTLDYFATDLSNLRQSSNVVVKAEDIVTDETSVVAADIHLASKKLLKDVVVVSKQLTQTYPNDEFIEGILREASNVKEGKGTFFTAINLLERTTTYLTLLIQKERCTTEEMLNDIHANLMNAISQTSVVKKLVDSSQESCSKVSQSMANELQHMEAKAKHIDTLDGMQQHIKDSVGLIAKLMNNYSDEQNQIHRANESTIQELTSQIESTSSFVDQLEKQLNVAEETNLIDELTTIGNRKGYVLRINNERKQWQATKQALTLMVIDVDNFKKINDTYGHSIGDQVLKCLGQTLKKHIRDSDYVARFGGEEFVIILPATEIERATQIGQKIQSVINSLKFELRKKSKVLKMTCSFGIAGFSQQVSNSTDVFNLADKALYQAKEMGRDCIVVAKGDKLVKVESEKATT